MPASHNSRRCNLVSPRSHEEGRRSRMQQPEMERLAWSEWRRDRSPCQTHENPGVAVPHPSWAPSLPPTRYSHTWVHTALELTSFRVISCPLRPQTNRCVSKGVQDATVLRPRRVVFTGIT